MTVDRSFTESRNADWEYLWQFVATVSGVANTPVDMTGATLLMDVAKPTGEKQLKLRLGSGLEWVDITTGKAKLFVPRARVFGLAAGSYVHDLLIVRGTLVTRYWSGNLTLADGVTDAG